MFDLIVDVEKVRPNEEIQVKAQAPNQEELLIAWLRELLYRFDTTHQVFSEFEVSKMNDISLEGRARGEKMDPKRHGCKKEVKAVTYHGLSLREEKGNWVAEVIFDV